MELQKFNITDTGHGPRCALADFDNVAFLRGEVERLWQLLDDIDTAGDICKDNDKAFRRMAMALADSRSKHIVSDGYRLSIR
jgi:hypothetical protein